MYEFFLLGSFGIFSGFLAGFFGIGGGGFIVNLLVLWGYGVKYAIGLAVMQMVFGSIFGTYINYKRGVLKFGEGVYLGIGGLIGAGFSGLVVKYTPVLYLEILFAFILALGIVKILLKKGSGYRENLLPKWGLILIGAAIGIVGVSVGVGGGALITLIFFGILGYDIKKTVPMGLLFVIFSGVSGLASLSIAGHVDYVNGLFLGLGSLVGVYFGTIAAIKINREKQRWLNLLFNVVMFILALKQIIDSLFS